MMTTSPFSWMNTMEKHALRKQRTKLNTQAVEVLEERIVLSAVGLFTYNFILPAFGSAPIAPEWAWGFFAAAGGIFGSWAASKTQMFVPEHFLKLMLGGVTGIVGTLYIINFFYPLPFKL